MRSDGRTDGRGRSRERIELRTRERAREGGDTARIEKVLCYYVYNLMPLHAQRFFLTKVFSPHVNCFSPVTSRE